MEPLNTYWTKKTVLNEKMTKKAHRGKIRDGQEGILFQVFVHNAIRHGITSRKITNSDEYNTQYGYVQVASAYGTNAANPLVASIK